VRPPWPGARQWNAIEGFPQFIWAAALHHPGIIVFTKLLVDSLIYRHPKGLTGIAEVARRKPSPRWMPMPANKQIGDELPYGRAH